MPEAGGHIDDGFALEQRGHPLEPESTNLGFLPDFEVLILVETQN